MKKKFIAAVLALAMIMGIATIAMADDQKSAATDKGKAGITYERGKVEIIETDNTIIPKDWIFPTSRNVDFGEHDVFTNMTEQRYASWMESRGRDTDYVGIIFKNGTSDPLNVSVGIEPFKSGNDETLKGFELELVKSDFEVRDREVDGKMATITNPHGRQVTKPEGATANSSHSKFDITRDYKSGKIDAGSADDAPLISQVFSVPGLGVHAATWGGVLTVPANSVAYDGESQAVMTWNISIGEIIRS